MRAVVLVGGFGTRLRPLTSTIPKPMLPVGHLPIIERLVTSLGRSGITEVTLALGFKPEPFVQAFPDGTCAGVAMRYAVEPEPLDTAGAIRFAADAAGIDETFVVVNGDILTDLDVSQLVHFHRAHAAEATIHLIAVPDPSAFGVVALDDDGRVLRFVEKPAPGTAPSNLINAGTYVLEPSVLQRIPTGQKVSIERATFPLVAGDGGRPELYLQANLDVLAATRAHDRCQPVHETATVHPQAVVERSVVGAHAQVADATITGSVLLPGAVVESGAVVTDSVLMGRVGAGAVVHNCVLGADGVVAPGEHLRDQRRPDPNSGSTGT